MLRATSRFGRWMFAGLLLSSVPATWVWAQEQEGDAAAIAEDEARQVQIAERFTTVLEKNPRRGTALDRVYGHHVEFGTLDEFLQGLRAKVAKAPEDGAAWMLLGLFEAHRGEDASAIEAFRNAEQRRAGDALASYYLGQSLLLVGQPEEAVAAFERAIERNPPRTDLLEIFQQLGRVHQRAQRTEAALAVWQRLESLFPNDPRVQEQIAVTLVEEGQYALALPRYEQLAKLVRDDYRRVVFQIEAAELKIRQNRRDEGLADLEQILADLNPDSWLHRDVRRRMEEVFLRTGDQDGLVKYYETWTERHPEDVDAMARLAKFLASAARVPEATQWMEKALKLAPTRIELRRAFIDQLVDDGRYPEAIAQFELLSKSAPTNADLLRDWGKLVLRDKSQDLEKRKAEATRIWQQIIAARPDDAVTLAQVADLFRQANINDEAIALYQKAIELAPAEPQYREYLGEFYHVLKRPEDALATWRAIAEEPRRTAVNVARLAEVYNSFGYLPQAIQEIAAACKLDPKDFSLELTAADYHTRAEKYDEALAFVDAAEKLVANDDERESVIKARIEVLQSSRRLEDEIEQMAAKIGSDPAASAGDWHILARYYEADRRWNDATEAIEQALAKDQKSIPAITTAARIAELSGDFARAAEMNRQLAAVDRRSRSDHLMNVARLESQMGRTDEALAAGKDLLASAPGNTDNYEFFAQLCFRLGKPEEGLDALRKAVRINPTEPHLTTALGSALAEQFRTDEAIEVYWRAFDRTEEIDDKTSLTQRLTELYLQTNQFDKLIERFERERQEDEKRREMTICLAQAHHSSGDYGTARHELESLLNQESQDTNLLQQLSKLCEQGSDLEAAIDYQRRLVEIAPGAETEFRLAGLLQSSGDREEASEIYVRLTRREEDPARLLRSIDSLLTQGSYDSVLAITEPLLSQTRDDWELLYREAVAWASLEKQQEASDRCQRLLALTIPHDALGVAAEEKFKQAQSKARSDNLRGLVSRMPKRQSPLTMLNMSAQVRQATGLDADRYAMAYYGGMGPQRVWTPDSFGVARMAAYGWLLKFEEDARQNLQTEAKDTAKGETFVDSLAKAAAAEGADRETLYDWMYVEQLRGNYDSIFRISKRLAQEGGKEEQRFYLSSLRLRNVSSQQQLMMRSGAEAAKKDPLTDDELNLMLACYENLADDDPTQDAASYGGQITYDSSGQMYVNVGGNWIQVSGGYSGNIFLGGVLEDLKLSGREAKAKELLDAMVARADSAQELSAAMNLLFAQEDWDRLDDLYPRWVEAAKDDVAKAPAVAPRRATPRQTASALASNARFLIQWMGKLGPDEEHARILSILDPALDLAIEEAQKRRAARSPRAQSSFAQQQQYYGTGYSLMYGKEQLHVNVDYPRPNEYVDHSTLMLLRQVLEVFKRNDVVSDLPDHLRKRLENASPDDLVYEQLILGYVLWWTEDQEEAVQILTTAAERFQDDPAFRLEMATLHETLGDPDRAFEIVESIAPRDQKLVQQREMMALQLAERLGDVERARQAAERLFGLRLDNDSQLALVDRMRRLGLNEMAEAVVSRVHRRTGNQASSLTTLMAMYQGQGKVDLAQQIAHTILRRTTPAMSSMAMQGRFRLGARMPTDASRMRALQLLQQTGALKEMMQRLETQLEQSPESPKLYEQLIEYYQATGTRDKVQALLEKAIEARPDAIPLRLQLAQHLEQTGKVKEACDQYLELLRQKPALLAQDFYSVRRVFDRAQRVLDLVKALENINLQSMGHPYYVIDLVGELLQNRRGQASEDNTEIAIALFERVFEAFPTYRNQLISRIYNQELWKNERVYALAKRGIVPSATEVSAQPWYGVDSIYSYSSGGTVNAMFHQMLNGLRGTDKLADLRKTISAAAEQNPAWHGGQTMLALIDLKENKKTDAKERLEKLVADDEVLKSMPPDACWIVGQELDQFEDTRAIALRLFETAVSADQRNQSQIQYSPTSRLVKLYASMDRKEDARELLLKQLRSFTGDQYDVQYGSYMRTENSIWAANQFLELGSAVDAVRIFRELMDDTETLAQAGAWYGNQPEQFTSQAQNGLKKALASIKEADAGEAIKQLLAPSTDVSSDQPVLDLMLSAPDAKTVRTRELDSSLARLLKSISQDAKIGAEIDARLTSLANEHPQDFSVPVAQALHRVNAGDERAAQSLAHLATMVAAVPLDEIPTDRRPNSRQRREAFTRVPLWLVAREFVTKSAAADLRPDQTEAAEKLALHALEAARRQVDNKYFVAILYDWGKRAIEADDRETAEEKWSELLEAVTRRPERREPPGRRAPPGPAAPAPTTPNRFGRRIEPIRNKVDFLPAFSWLAFLAPIEGAPAANQPATLNTVPPLTISQFRLATEVALAAAEHGFAELSQRAVEKAMAGGIPVPDPEESGPGMRGRVAQTARIAAFASGRGVPGDGAGSTEAEVASTLRRVLEKWHGEEYSPAAVYELLHPIVFPASRPADILLYADTSKIRDAQAVSLGATLVSWAHRADKLPDLIERIAKRKGNPQSLIPALVLETLVDLSEQQHAAAGAHLDELAAAVEKGALPQMVQLACLAAIPAADVPELRNSAYKILQVSVRQQAEPDASGNATSLGALVGMVNKFLAKEPQKVKEFFERFIVGRQANYARYSGDYGLYLQWRDWANIADEAAKAGVPAVALDYMGRVADFSYQDNPRPSLKNALAIVCRVLRSQSAQQRYQAWRDWTLPAEGRQTVRLIAEWVEPITAPEAFLPANWPRSVPRDEYLLCNVHELLDAAEEAGKFKELRDQARSAWEQKLPGAETLWALILVRANEPQALEPILAEMKRTLPERSKREQNKPVPDLWGDYLVYRACMQSPEFGRLYGQSTLELRRALHSQYQFQALAHVSYDLLDRTAVDTAAQLRPGDPSGLLHWLAVAPRDLTTSSKPTWLVHEGHVTHLPGPPTDTLLLAYPVTGDFQLSFDSFQGEWAETDAGYGGIICETWSGAVVNSIAGHESVRHPATLRRSGFNRVDLRVAEGKMKFYVNNHLAYEEDASPTSPWLMLYTHGARTTIFRNLALTGNPVIPREVQLFSDNRMDGWNCTFFGETQPRFRFMAQKPRDENDYIYYEQQREPAEHDWSTQNGVLSGNPKSDMTEFAQSWVYYHRPLCDGETFQYEFFYVPGTSAAYPTIGRLAFLLEPSGAKLHWIASGNWDEAVLGIPQDNRITEPECRRGPEKLSLKANDWNKVAVTLHGDRVVVALNDVEVYERPLEPDNHRLFGIFRDRRQAAKVRGAVLTGPWPEKFTPELRRDLIATNAESSEADRRLVGTLLDEAFAAHEVVGVVERARSLPLTERFELLKQWVLPSPDHANLRLYFRHASTAVHAGEKDDGELQAGSKAPSRSLTETGRGLISPACELVDTASQLQKLPELRKAISQLAAESTSERRNKQALLAIVEMKLGNDDTAKNALTALHESVNKDVPKSTSPRERSPEFLAAWMAAERPALVPQALELARRLRSMEWNDDTASGNYNWRHGLYALVGHLETAKVQHNDVGTPGNPVDQWFAVHDRNPEYHYHAWRPSAWHTKDGMTRHLPGGTVTRLFFQSPLAGKFEIIAEQSVDPRREIALTYAGHAAVPRHDLKAKRITTLPSNNRDVAVELNVPNWGPTAEIRIVVDGTKVITFAGGEQIHEEFVTPNPWLVLQATSAGNDSVIQNLRITGTPEIPTELDLIDSMSPAFWQADLYRESVALDDGGESSESAAWRRTGEELVGELRTDRSAKPLESLLAYQRPMLEDGTIEFEMYYVPDEFEVHPAVGHQALVIRPEGVKLHLLTGAQWETSGLEPDNEMTIDGAAEDVPLREKDWNRIALRLVGDRLTVSVNGTEVVQHTLPEPPAERFFGLFRYGDQTKCRVRKLVYRGDWPKEIPAGKP